MHIYIIYMCICIFFDPLYIEMYPVCNCCTWVRPNQNHLVPFKPIQANKFDLTISAALFKQEHGFLSFSSFKSVSMAAISLKVCLMGSLNLYFFPFGFNNNTLWMLKSAIILFLCYFSLTIHRPAHFCINGQISAYFM